MQDIPLFTTQSGVATLILKKVPYTQAAYVKIQDSLEPEQLVKECCDFCRAAGASHIYASGHAVLEKYPHYTTILAMSRAREGLPETDASLFPVQPSTLDQWRTLYNEKMLDVPNAAYMTIKDSQKLIQERNAYFVHRGDAILGIGIAAGETVNAIVSNRPGAGRDVLLALNHALSGDRISLSVASTNNRAVGLYTRLGFVCTEEISRWYQII